MRDVLYTPWRAAYLMGGGVDPHDGCLFCTLPLGDDRESLIVYRGRTAYVVLNRYPYSNGHLMVSPFAHRGTLESLSPEERHELVDLGASSEAALREEYRPHGFNLGLNIGRSGGAGVLDHAHLHVVPRWDGDTNFLGVVAGTRIVPEDLDVTHRRLLARFALSEDRA